MRIIQLVSIGFVLLTISALAASQADRNKEVDLAFAKLLTYLPEDAQLIHAPYADQLLTYGNNHTVQRFTDTDVTGGKSIKVSVKKAGKNVWDDAVFADVGGSINAGDVVYMMFWVRAHTDDNNQAQGLIQGAGMQKSSAPYETIIGQNIQLEGTKWQTIALATRVAKSYPSKGTRVNMPLAARQQTLEFGPVFVFNLGPNAKLEELPFL